MRTEDNGRGPDADERSGLRPRCPKCLVTHRGRLWYLRHRIFVCDPRRLEIRAVIDQRRQALYSQEVPF